jgi:hypothetical protein
MKKSKRERQIELLEKLLNRVNISSQDINIVRENTDWIHRKMSQVKGGDIKLDSDGLTQTDMLKANNMWSRHCNPLPHNFEYMGMEPANDDMPA